jgi:hypothetical protein
VARLIAVKEWGKSYHFPKDSFLYSTDGIAHSFRALPDTVKVRGNILITNLSNVRLPDMMILTGYLFIAGTNVEKSPSYLDCNNVEIINSHLPRVSSVLQTKKLDITGSRIDKLFNIGHISEDVAILQSQRPSEPPDAVRIGGNLRISPDALTKLPSNIVVMGDLLSPEEFEPSPFGVDFLGRLLQPGDHVRFLGSPRITHNGKAASRPVTGFCARFKGCDGFGNALLAIEDDAYAEKDEIIIASCQVLKCSAAEYSQRRISYASIMDT